MPDPLADVDRTINLVKSSTLLNRDYAVKAGGTYRSLTTEYYDGMLFAYDQCLEAVRLAGRPRPMEGPGG